MPFYTGLTHDLFIDQAIHFQAGPQNLPQTMWRIQIAQEELCFSQLLHVELPLASAGMLQQKTHHLNLVHSPLCQMENALGDFPVKVF